MTLPDPVFFESWLGYDGYNGDTRGARSRWSGAAIPVVGLVDVPPHRAVRFTFGSFSRNIAALDRPILDGLFCLHMNMQFINILESHDRDFLQICGDNPAEYLLGFSLNAGRIRITRNNFGTTLAQTPPASIPNSAMHSIIVHGRIHPTLGELHVLINGFNVLSLTDIDTRGSVANNEIHWIAISEPRNFPHDNLLGPIALFDDNVAMKPARFERLVPDQDLTPLDWVRDSGGHNFSRINEEFYNDDGFVASSTPGATDAYRLTNMSAPPAEIYGVGIRANLHKISAGTRIVRLGVRDNGVSGWGEQLVLPASRISATRCVGKSPDTGLEFTFAQINDLNLLFDISV